MRKEIDLAKFVLKKLKENAESDHDELYSRGPLDDLENYLQGYLKALEENE